MSSLDHVIALIGVVLEAVGVLIIALSCAIPILRLTIRLRTLGLDDAFAEVRTSVGRGILLGLEILIAGDIIRTVAVAPSLESVAVLAVIVLIRTFLSMTIEVEVEGRWPWQRKRATPENER